MYHKFIHSFVSLVLALAFFTAGPTPQPARAAGPWYVATTGDDNNDCLSPLTPCATIQMAIERATAGDTINVAIGTYTGTGNRVVFLFKDITLSGGWDDAFVTKNGKSTIDGQGVRRGITVNSVATVEAFIIQNGVFINNGGGIFNSGTLTLNSSTVSGNSTDFGGGIINVGTLILNYSTVSGNSATTFGGGILNGGVMTLNYSTVKDNSGAVGGIANSGGTLTLNNSTVSGNSSTGSGGGVLNAGGPTGTVTLNNTTVSGNSAIDDGGGVANFSSTGAVTLNYSTVTNNTSDSDNDGNGYGGGVFSGNSNGLVNLQSNIVAGNKTGSSGTNDMTADCLIYGVLISQGYNLTGNGTGCDPLGSTGDVTITPASVFTDVLGVLANNGGATKTHALIVSGIFTNPALNVITSGTNSCGTSPFDLDQRNIIRPQDSACDIGAFELIPPIPPFPTTPINIDIKPGSNPSPINLGSKGVVPVAVLTTDEFDASTLDPATVVFAGASPLRWVQQDVDWDGDMDLLLHFNTLELKLNVSNIEAVLTGKTFEGISVEGSDLVKIVPAK